MFRLIYEICAAVFLLQGALLIPLLIVAGFSWYRQDARLKAVAAALGRDRADRDRTLGSLLASLPTLRPLACAACGGALAFDADAMICTRCRTPAPLPPDYAATAGLRRGLSRLTRAAQVHWAQAWVLTAAPTRLLLKLMVIGEPALFGVMMVGAATYSDTWLDRWFERMGEHLSLTLMILGFGGFIIWMVAFILLARLAGELRRKLPAFPRIDRETAATAFATCRSCGGGVEYPETAFAALCGYCGIENYREGYARRARGKAEGEQVETRATLFGAMTIIEDFTGGFVVLMGILVLAFGLLVLVQALKD